MKAIVASDRAGSRQPEAILQWYVAHLLRGLHMGTLP